MTANPRPANRPDTLVAEHLSVRFEGLTAVDDVSLAIRRGEILGLIGPNGAGKTTLVNALSGFQKLTGGRVLLDDADVTSLPAAQLAQRGLTRTFQSVRVFAELSVFENVEAAALSTVRRRRDAAPVVWDLLRSVHLDDQAHRAASSLPYGDERKLGLVRALATQPAFLLLDEPAAGLDETESDDLMQVIGRVRDERGCGIMVIEHHMPLIMQLCDRIHVLDYGKTISEGTPMQIQADRTVIDAYLGTSRGVGRPHAEG